ncbi:MAG: hypothetical protein ACYC0F_14940 [Rhodanobacter sp.]
MKRHIDSLLQRPRGRFETSRMARRHPIPQSIAAGASLRPEDGYDWLRQIKPVQRGHSGR